MVGMKVGKQVRKMERIVLDSMADNHRMVHIRRRNHHMVGRKVGRIRRRNHRMVRIHRHMVHM